MKKDNLIDLFQSIGVGDIHATYSLAKQLAVAEQDINPQLAIDLTSALGVLPSDDYFDPTELLTITTPNEAPNYIVLPTHLEERFKRVEEEFQHSKRLKAKKQKHITKILLYGPPGCGKTLSAYRLSRNLNLNLAKVKLDTVVSKENLGQSLRNLRKLFDYARDNLCILLIDECDFVARARTSNGMNADMDRVVNVLLVLLDEYKSDSIIMATTNLESALDPALARRFDTVLRIALPNKEETLRILEDTITASGVYLDRGVDLKTYLPKLRGKNAAYIVRIANEAVKNSIMTNSPYVADSHLSRSVAEVSPI